MKTKESKSISKNMSKVVVDGHQMKNEMKTLFHTFKKTKLLVMKQQEFQYGP
ncbi:hypothetical protein Hdeb2414_s0026g00680261 [Helianthus debilis subsp. tardiflorus]